MKKVMVLNPQVKPDQYNLIGLQLSSPFVTFSEETIYHVGASENFYLYFHLMNNPCLDTILYLENMVLLPGRSTNTVENIFEVWNFSTQSIDLAYLRRSSTPPGDTPPSGGEPPGYPFVHYLLRSSSISVHCCFRYFNRLD